MVMVRIALLGFGNVGKALANLLFEKKQELLSEYGIEFIVSGIGTGRHGFAINERGIDLEKSLENVEKPGSMNDLSEISPIVDVKDFIKRCNAHILFESIPVNYLNGQPAVEYSRMALQAGMHVVSANKGPVVHAHQELTQIARQHKCKYYFEAAVMDGTPIFSLFRSTLPAARLLGFHGILNSTTNMILTLMEQGQTFDEAVAYCQKIGIAETDPAGDVDGWDAAVKVAALVTVLMKHPLLPVDVPREGIRNITQTQIKLAQDEKKRWKLVCKAELDNDKLNVIVQPQMVPIESPLYHVQGTSSLVQFKTDVLGSLTIFQDNPSPRTTAYGMLADFVNILRTDS